MSSPSPVGFGLYFIDVLACLLFCLTLALVGARFGREVSVPVELPQLAAAADPGSGRDATEIVLRESDGRIELLLEGTTVGLAELGERLTAAPPAAVVVRSETSMLADVIGAAHAAGVRDIQLAYRAARSGAARSGGGR